MARISFTLKSNVGSAASTTGSFLQAASVNYGADNPSALRADGYVTTPTSVPGSSSFLSASPTDYDKVYLSWGITTELATTVVATPAITTLDLRYSLIGPPQTLAEGTSIIQIQAENSASSFTHTDLPSGKWVYYTLFAKYESTDSRSWYERVVSTEVLVPKDYGYSDNLFRRIPLHYRVQDEQIGLTNLLIPTNDPYYNKIVGLPEHLKIAGPLQRMLDVFGWEINVIKTIIDYVMRQKDPFVANSEMVEKLAVEVGLPLTVADLGTAKLRELIADFTYLTQNEGLITGVEEYITAISGCNTRINASQPDLLTSTHHAMTSASVTTSASAVPATNQWLLQSSAHTMTAASVYPYSNMFTTTKALAITHSSGASVQMACLKTKVQSVSQASRLYMDFGATYNSLDGAHVLGWALSSTVQAASVVTPTISTRVNLSGNPSVEANISGWGGFAGGTTAASVSSTSFSGSRAVRYTAGTASASGYSVIGCPTGIPCTAGLTYTASVYAKHISGSPRNARIVLVWYNASSIISTNNGPASLLTSDIQRYTATATAPAGAVTFTIWGFLGTTGSSTSADVSDWDMCLIEQSSEVGRYFDNYDISGSSSSLESYVPAITDGSTSVYEYPIYLGTPGNGTLNTTDMYLHVWIASESSGTGTLYLIPNKVTTLNRYPYYIDVYSRRLNLVRDPQFTNIPSTLSQATSTVAYWRVATTSGTVSAAVANRVFIGTPSTSASVTLSTDVNNGGMQYTPINSGTDYFLSIDDYENNIVEVSIKNLDGSITLASATTPYIETVISGIAKRKYWKLEFVDNYPWYPSNSYLYHIEITATATATTPLRVGKPLLEPSSPGEYFDGNSDNGGWLGGAAGGAGAADYRWGASTAHTKFSYYTADYRRVVEATKRMIPYIVPVTETTYALASLRFNQIPGYTGAAL